MVGKKTTAKQGDSSFPRIWQQPSFLLYWTENYCQYILQGAFHKML